MAMTVDSAEFLIREIVKDLNSVQDKLLFIGGLYMIRSGLSLMVDISYAVRVFILPNISRGSMKDERGHWAGIAVHILHGKGILLHTA